MCSYAWQPPPSWRKARARIMLMPTTMEAIMWHCYSKKSHAYHAAMNFYKASKSDRDAVVKFLRSI